MKKPLFPEPVGVEYHTISFSIIQYHSVSFDIIQYNHVSFNIIAYLTLDFPAALLFSAFNFATDLSTLLSTFFGATAFLAVLRGFGLSSSSSLSFECSIRISTATQLTSKVRNSGGPAGRAPATQHPTSRRNITHVETFWIHVSDTCTCPRWWGFTYHYRQVVITGRLAVFQHHMVPTWWTIRAFFKSFNFQAPRLPTSVERRGPPYSLTHLLMAGMHACMPRIVRCSPT